MTPDQQKQFQARQKTRARVMAIGLLIFSALMFAITIAKIRAGMAG